GEVAVADRWIIVRYAPRRDDLGAGLGLQHREQEVVVGDREKRSRFCIAKLGNKRSDIREADIETFAVQQAQYLETAGDGVEANGVRSLPGGARIVGEHQGEPALRARRRGKPRPRGCTA